MAGTKKHFCSCTDLACPFNPNNPTNAEHGRGCDACIKKNLALGEVPSCIFKNLGSTEGWSDYSVEGFVSFVAKHPRSEEERRRCAKAAITFDALHGGKLADGASE